MKKYTGDRLRIWEAIQRFSLITEDATAAGYYAMSYYHHSKGRSESGVPRSGDDNYIGGFGSYDVFFLSLKRAIYFNN